MKIMTIGIDLAINVFQAHDIDPYDYLVEVLQRVGHASGFARAQAYAEDVETDLRGQSTAISVASVLLI